MVKIGQNPGNQQLLKGTNKQNLASFIAPARPQEGVSVSRKKKTLLKVRFEKSKETGEKTAFLELKQGSSSRTKRLKKLSLKHNRGPATVNALALTLKKDGEDTLAFALTHGLKPEKEGGVPVEVLEPLLAFSENQRFSELKDPLKKCIEDNIKISKGKPSLKSVKDFEKSLNHVFASDAALKKALFLSSGRDLKLLLTQMAVEHLENETGKRLKNKEHEKFHAFFDQVVTDLLYGWAKGKLAEGKITFEGKTYKKSEGFSPGTQGGNSVVGLYVNEADPNDKIIFKMPKYKTAQELKDMNNPADIMRAYWNNEDEVDQIGREIAMNLALKADTNQNFAPFCFSVRTPDGKLGFAMKYLPGDTVYNKQEKILKDRNENKRLRQKDDGSFTFARSEIKTLPKNRQEAQERKAKILQEEALFNKISRISQLLLVEDMVSSLKAFHDKGAIHGDLKGAAFLVNEDGRAVLSDFGTARIEGSLTDREIVVDTTTWMSPEYVTARDIKRAMNYDLLEKTVGKLRDLPWREQKNILETITSQQGDKPVGVTNKTDHWALGVSIMEVFGVRAYAHFSFYLDIFSTIREFKKDVIAIGAGGKVSQESTGIPEIDALINGLVQKNPDDRLPLDQVLATLQGLLSGYTEEEKTMARSYLKGEFDA